MWWGGDYLARKNKLFIFKTERVSLILRIVNIFVAYECLLFKAIIHSIKKMETEEPSPCYQ